MREVPNRGVDVADDHEAQRDVDLVREEVDREEVEAQDDDAIGQRLDDRAFCGLRMFSSHSASINRAAVHRNQAVTAMVDLRAP